MKKPNPKKYIDNLPEFLKDAISYERYNNGVFYKNCNIEYMVTVRRRKGYFGYYPQRVYNAFVKVERGFAYVFTSQFVFIINKMVYGKYIKMSGGKEITKKTYLKHKTKCNVENNLIV